MSVSVVTFERPTLADPVIAVIRSDQSERIVIVAEGAKPILVDFEVSGRPVLSFPPHTRSRLTHRVRLMENAVHNFDFLGIQLTASWTRSA